VTQRRRGAGIGRSVCRTAAKAAGERRRGGAWWAGAGSAAASSSWNWDGKGEEDDARSREGCWGLGARVGSWPERVRGPSPVWNGRDGPRPIGGRPVGLLPLSRPHLSLSILAKIFVGPSLV
jgi:hypothetical protein